MGIRVKERLTSVSRRDFLRVGGLSVVGLSMAEQAVLAASRGAAARRSCILLLMTGGASQLDTFDPKPSAPAEIRGPARAISTAIPGVHFSESMPMLARRANRFAVVRSLHHDAAPIHETGLQLLQTGRLARGAVRYPAFGSVIARAFGPRRGAPPYVVLPRSLGNTGVEAYRGQESGLLGAAHDPQIVPTAPVRADSTPGRVAGAKAPRPCHGSPAPGHASLSPGHANVGDRVAGSERSDGPDVSVPGRRKASGPATHAASLPGEQSPGPSALAFREESRSLRTAYGETRFGRLCLHARQLVEAGVRCVTVNLFDSLSGQVTWDCHARGPSSPATLYDYRDTLCPQFDRACAALLDDLHQRGMLADTLVVAAGEFGRTPRINEFGGRDHWPGVWSALVAGGGVRGGQVIGASDAHGAAPLDRPITPAQLTATIYHALGLEPDIPLTSENGDETAIVDAAPVMELFG